MGHHRICVPSGCHIDHSGIQCAKKTMCRQLWSESRLARHQRTTAIRCGCQIYAPKNRAPDRSHSSDKCPPYNSDPKTMSPTVRYLPRASRCIVCRSTGRAINRVGDLKRALGCGNADCAKRGSGKGGYRKSPAIHEKLLIVRGCCKTCAVSLGQNMTQRTQM